MVSLGLIIQRTTSGLNDLFVSDNLKEIRKSHEIESATGDESKHSTKLANQSNVYTVQLTPNYTVYSLVVTHVTDSFGRAGFYVIRLFAPKRYPIGGYFESILANINNKYLEYERNQVPKSHQDYDECLNYDFPSELRQWDVIAANTEESAYCFYDATASSLNTVFNNWAIALYHKLYAFDKESAVSANIIESLGLKSFTESSYDAKQVKIHDNYNLLNELKINGVSVDFNRNEKDFILTIKKEYRVEYNTSDDAKFREITDSSIFIERKRTMQPEVVYNAPRKKKGFWDENGMYVVMSLMVLVLGSGCWFFLIRDPESEIETNPTPPSDSTYIDTPDTKNIENETEKTIVFIRDGTKKDSTIFKTDYLKLQKYRFSLDGGKWSYMNTEKAKVWVSFIRKNLDDIIEVESLPFNEDKKTEFFKALESAGGKPVASKNEEDATKKPTTGKKQEGSTGKTGSQTPPVNKKDPKKDKPPVKPKKEDEFKIKTD